MLNPGWIMAAALALLPAAVQAGAAAVRTPVERFEPLLHEALRAADGAARGVLAGPMAVAVSRQFGTSAPIEIDVSTVLRYAQDGCARLRVEVAQQGVRLQASAKAGEQHVRFELNYCQDGLPPRSLAVRGPR